jgi:hypothetical protein
MAQIILDSNNNLIQGDFDNATVNNRTKFKTTTTNATTNVYAVPNGSATSAGYSVANNADPTNCSKIVMATNGSTDTQIISGVNGSGSYLPMSFYVNNALAAQISTAGKFTMQSASAAAPGGTALLLSDSTGSSSNQFGIEFNSAIAGNAGSAGTGATSGGAGGTGNAGTTTNTTFNVQSLASHTVVVAPGQTVVVTYSPH